MAIYPNPKLDELLESLESVYASMAFLKNEIHYGASLKDLTIAELIFFERKCENLIDTANWIIARIRDEQELARRQIRDSGPDC